MSYSLGADNALCAKHQEPHTSETYPENVVQAGTRGIVLVCLPSHMSQL